MNTILDDIFSYAKCLLEYNYPYIKFNINSKEYKIISIKVLFSIDLINNHYEIKCTDKYILKLLFIKYYRKYDIRKIYTKEYFSKLKYLQLEVKTDE